MNLRDTPIQGKLMKVILWTCAIVLGLMCSAYVVLEFYTFKEITKNNISTVGLITASHSSAALAFDSKKDADEILNALRADEHIVSACLYDKYGNLFAKYPAGIDDSMLPSKPQKNGYIFKDGFLEGFQPVIQSTDQLGTLYIKSDLGAMYAQLRQYGIVAVLLITVSLLIAYLLSNMLQKTISGPIIMLEQTAKIVSDKHDYSVRAIKTGNDEMGFLTDSFNYMLTQIEAQTIEIKQAEEENAQLAAIVEFSEDAIIGLTLEGVIKSWNKGAERTFEYTADEIIGELGIKIIPSASQDAEASNLTLLKRGEHLESFQTQGMTKSKRQLDISLTVSSIKDNEGNIIGISKIARDISKQKQIERLIIQREEHLRLATQAAELGTFDLDLINHTMEWDTRCRELFGIYDDRIVTYDNHFLNGLYPDDRERVSKVIEAAFDKDQNNGNYDVEYRVIGIEDEKLRWIRAKGKVFFNEESKPVRFLGAVLEITDKKQEELRKNGFLAVVSHELKTPLTSLKSYIQILLAKANKDVDDFKLNMLSRAEIQTNKMASMIQDFLSIARLEEGKVQLNKEKFDLKSLIEHTIDEAYYLLSEQKIEIKDCESILIYADKEKIGQVLTNLLSNAIKYSPKDSIIIIGCEKSDKKVKVYVRDEGIGIGEKDQLKLFDRFYRVEDKRLETVSGFGIGLYLVSENLKYHDSEIKVESREGAGSTFYFSLPLDPASKAG